MSKKIRVLLADDSAMARGLLRSYLEDEEDFEVVGEARHGEEAVAMAIELTPDLITMDLEMPRMGGLEAIEEIMCLRAAPILVVSSVADAHNAYAAVAHGALDVVAKPSTDAHERREFISKARLVAGVKVITHVRSRYRGEAASGVPAAPRFPVPETLPERFRESEPVVVIAASTGGPQALAEILPMLPADFPAPILVAQHISAGFAAGMAEWLATLSPLPVRLGKNGDALEPGVVTVAPSEYHMVLTAERRIWLRERTEGDLYRPSCDLLLQSVADTCGRHSLGVILTGMGRDGSQGIQAIHAAGGLTLAQDEGSSVIFGMNAHAIASGAVDEVVTLEQIAASMVRLLGELA